MKKYIYIGLLLGFVFGQSAENEEKKDSTFIFFESGDSIRVNKLDASFKIQPMIEFDLKFSDFDSTKYDISKANKVADSQGKTLINKNTLFEDLEFLITHPEKIMEYGEKGKKWVEKNHHYSIYFVFKHFFSE